jgi:hypothetical protein
MAKRRTRTRRRRSFGGIVRRARGVARGGGGFSPVIQGMIAGIASQVGQKFLPGYGGPLGVGAAGYFTGNQTLLTLAGMQASALLPLGGILGTTQASNGGGGYL